MNSERKIIRLFSRLNIGGPAIHVVNLSAGLKRYGFETILVVGSSDPSEGSMDTWALERGVNLCVIPSFRAALSPVHDLIAFFSILRLMLREKPDLVHTHTFKAGVLGRLAAAIAGVPLVIHTYHGHLLTGYWGRVGTELIRWIETLLAKLTHHIVAVSQQVAQDLIEAGLAPPEKIHVVELGFDVPAMHQALKSPPSLRRDLKIPKEAQVVGIVGRLVPVKSVDRFLRSLVPLLEQNPRLHLVVIGDGIERAKLESEAAQLTKSGRVHFSGWRRPVIPDLPDLDLCVCSSKNEGTSVSIIEAVIAGVPVVSTKVGGMGDLLGQGLWGDLVADEEGALRDAVAARLEILAHPETAEFRQLRARSEQAAAFFSRRFSVDRLLEDIQTLYSMPPSSLPLKREPYAQS